MITEAICRVRPLTENDLMMLLSWRNHPDVRRHMFNSQMITLEEHKKWFYSALDDSYRNLLAFEISGVPRGFVQLTFNTTRQLATWGFYVAPDAPRGTGGQLGRSAITYAFQELALHKLFGQVLAGNERSIRLHQSLRFHTEGVLRDHHFDGAQYHNVVCFGLLRAEWTTTS